jgi:hypothetical protein
MQKKQGAEKPYPEGIKYFQRVGIKKIYDSEGAAQEGFLILKRFHPPAGIRWVRLIYVG